MGAVETLVIKTATLLLLVYSTQVWMRCRKENFFVVTSIYVVNDSLFYKVI